ncbi:MAG: Maf family protein [Kiritimatiellae bacterium]|nr:Maf family protein [Kiritimatiellia bacterium]MDD4342112.1 Maf family protein [Kiritimatiellia bacterium]
MDKSCSESRPLVLASASPRRRGYLHQLGYIFTVVSPDMDETPRAHESAREYVLRNARDKAAEVAARVSPEAVIVAADTVVVREGRIMEKPASADGARQMLEALSGQMHQVITGVCVRGKARNGAATSRCFAVTTDVEFKELSAAEMEAYIESGEPLDKAGAYAIQGRAAYMIRHIRGSYTNVVGLPLTELEEVLASEFGIHPTFCGPAGA